MSTRINLLTRSQNYYTYEFYFKIFRFVTYGLIGFFFVFTSVFFAIKQNKKNELDEILGRKQGYLKYFAEKNKSEAEFVYFAKKEKQMKDFLKDDVRIELLPYYKLLTETIQSIEGITLTGSKIDLDHGVGFSIAISNYESVNNIFKFIESEEFLGQFEDLKLNSFSASPAKNGSYQLGFAGHLKEINENQ